MQEVKVKLHVMKVLPAAGLCLTGDKLSAVSSAAVPV